MNKKTYIFLIVFITISLFYLNFYIGEIWGEAPKVWWQIPTKMILILGNMLLPALMGMHLIETWKNRK